MKTVLFLSILCFVIAMPLCAETQEIAEMKADIEKIKTDLVTVKTDLAVLTSEFKAFKESVNERFDRIEKDFDRIETNFGRIDRNFDRQNNIIIACIGIPLGIIAIGVTVWGLLAHRRGVQDTAQRKEIETLKEEIETLKQRLLVSR